MPLHYQDNTSTVIHGDCIEAMREMPDNSVDSIVTDPPYGLGFMGKAWDDLPPGVEWAAECLRILKPGGHLLAFGGTRTWHRLAVAIEDAGFEIRDSIAWLYGSGFPKSLDVSKAVDKQAGATRELVGSKDNKGRVKAEGWGMAQDASGDPITAPATPAAEKWAGWGTALKPAFEPVVVGRKPLIGTVAANVLTHGTGALNIDASRIENTEYDPTKMQKQTSATAGMNGLGDSGFKADHVQATYNAAGRFPANVILDETQAVALDQQSGISKGRGGAAGLGKGRAENASSIASTGKVASKHDDEGGASRFFKVIPDGECGAPVEWPMCAEAFGECNRGSSHSGDCVQADEPSPRFKYVAKAPKSERPVVDGVAHPTVKPLALMRYLVRLVTPTGGVVLDPFGGSGATLEACALEGFRHISMEREAEYLPLIMARVDRAGLGVEQAA